jgi:hypothetical protein
MRMLHTQKPTKSHRVGGHSSILWEIVQVALFTVNVNGRAEETEDLNAREYDRLRYSTSEKTMSTVESTSTAAPFSSAGLYSHLRSASRRNLGEYGRPRNNFRLQHCAVRADGDVKPNCSLNVWIASFSRIGRIDFAFQLLLHHATTEANPGTSLGRLQVQTRGRRFLWFLGEGTEAETSNQEKCNQAFVQRPLLCDLAARLGGCGVQSRRTSGGTDRVRASGRSLGQTPIAERRALATDCEKRWTSASCSASTITRASGSVPE